MSGFLQSRRGKSILIGGVVFLLLLLLGNILIVGGRLSNLHPAVGWVFYGLMAAGVLWLVVSPLWEYMNLPPLSSAAAILNEEAGTVDYALCRKVARRLCTSEALCAEEQAQISVAEAQGSDLLPLLRAALSGPVKQAMDDRIYRTAKGVMVASVVSQSSSLDALIVAASSIKLIQQLVRLTGYRPSWVQLGKLYVNVFLTALLVEALEDVDVGDFLASLHTMPAVPGLNFAAQAFLQGMGCTFFVLRIGLITQKYLYQDVKREGTNNIRRRAFMEAAPILKKLIKENVRSFPTEMRTLLEKYVF